MADKITPLYLAQAQVHTYFEKRWIPLQSKVTTLSILFDAGRDIYRIMGVDNDTHKTTVNSTIVPTLRFYKTSCNFGHWTDERTNTIYGVGFRGFDEIDLFLENLYKAQAFVLPSQDKKSPTDPTDVTAPPSTSSQGQSPLPALTSSPTRTPTPNPIEMKRPSQSSPRSLLEPFQARSPPTPFLPAMPVSSKGSRNSSSHNQPSSSTIAKLVEAAANLDLDWKPTALYPMSKISYKLPNPIPDATSTSEFEDFIKKNPVMKEPPMYHVLSDKRSKQSKSFLNNGQMFPTPSFGRHGHCRMGANATGDFFLTEESEMEDTGLMAELHRVKDENVRLKKILIESSTNLKKWELQMETIRSDNSVLHQKLQEKSSELEDLKKQNKKLLEKNTELDDLKKQSNEIGEATRLWKETIANNSANLQLVKEKEQKIQIVLGENAKLRAKIKEIQEKRCAEKLRAEAALKEQEMQRAESDQQLAALEAHYKEMLEKAQSPMTPMQAIVLTTKPEQKPIAEVDSLFTKAIQELISIHGEIYNSPNSSNNTNNNSGINAGESSSFKIPTNSGSCNSLSSNSNEDLRHPSCYNM